MALQNTVDFELTVTDRMDFSTAMPKSGDSGDFENTITDRTDFEDFVEATAVAVVLIYPGRNHPSKNLSLRM